MVVLITLPCYEAEAHAGEAARICFSFTDRRLRLLPLLSPSPHPPRGLLARILRLLITLLSSLLRSLHSRRHTPTMYPTLVSVALFSALAIQGALADFTVVTPPEFVQVRARTFIPPKKRTHKKANLVRFAPLLSPRSASPSSSPGTTRTQSRTMSSSFPLTTRATKSCKCTTSFT